MRLVYPKAKVYLYDDGIGSYYGSMAHDYNSKLLQAMNRLFFRGKLILEPEAMYLTLPELCRNTLSCPRHILPTLPEEKLAILDRIFDYQMNSVYEEHRMVYLTQPFEEIPDISIETEPALLRLLEKYSKDTVVRVHPRQKDAQFGHLMRDPYENLWEMECLRQLTDRNVLISFCSTAQFMPKMLGSTQPYLIFLYRLFGKELSGTMTEVLQEFTRQYSKPDRIFIPETLEELEQLLERLMGPCEAL